MSVSNWQWDTVRRAYYCWSAEEGCYVLQDGTRIGSSGASHARESIDTRIPRNTSPVQEATAVFAHTLRRDSTSNAGANAQYRLEQQFSGLNITPGPYGSRSHSGYGSNLQTAFGSSPYRSFSQPELHNINRLHTEGEDITDKELYKKGARARGKIKGGTGGKAEQLDPKYHIQGRDFFKVGKIIKILWPELPGNSIDGLTVVSDVRFTGETFITKIRWFVVVKEGRESCTCVPISTYGGRGTGKKGLAKWQHCIVYTSREEPEPLQEEIPVEGEMPMLSSIQVRQRDQREKMFPASRINYAKMYTVEHNVKVYDFGEVRKGSLSALVKQWKWVLDNNLQGTAPDSRSTTKMDTDSENSEPEDNDDAIAEVDDEIQPDVKLPARGTALWPWTANENRQLAFATGDTIVIEKWADENWGRGKNNRTGKRGIFPRNYVNIED